MISFSHCPPTCRYADTSFSACPVVKAHGSVDVVVAFGGEEKKLDTAGTLLPLVSDNRLHNISLRFLVLGQNRCGSVAGFQSLACVIEKFLISDEIPVGMLVLEFDFHKVLLTAEVNNSPLESRLDHAFDRPGLAALHSGLVNDTCAGAIEGSGNFLWPFGPTEAEGRNDLFRMSRLSVPQAEQSGHKP